MVVWLLVEQVSGKSNRFHNIEWLMVEQPLSFGGFRLVSYVVDEGVCVKVCVWCGVVARRGRLK